ncbi:MAG: response regulator transcription factor [Verrucomicrobiae bacterium]|nr:response regulator transcription factor [Verrucomicrobiae bacterium]
MKKARAIDLSAKLQFKVALVECQPEIRNYWLNLINRFPDFVCSCSCATAEDALRTVPKIRPDVILMNICLPDISGIECIIRLKKSRPQIPLVILTSADDREIVFRALAAGADGYLLLDQTRPLDLQAALFNVLQKGSPMTSQITRCVVESFRRQRNLAAKTHQFSLTEEWILMLLCRGYTNGLIARKMRLSVHTICFYLKDIFKKLGVRSRTQAAAAYMRSKTPLLKPKDLCFFTDQSEPVINPLPHHRILYHAQGHLPN